MRVTVAVLADAVRRLRAQGDPTPLVCVGDGPLRPVLEVRRGARGRDLVKVLGETGMAELCFAVLLAIIAAVLIYKVAH